jgi:hypothetical protein
MCAMHASMSDIAGARSALVATIIGILYLLKDGAGFGHRRNRFHNI